MTATPITVEVPHRLGAAEAKHRLDTEFGQLERQFGAGGLAQVERRWVGDRMTFSARALGQLVTGHMDVRDDHVRLEVVLPGFLGAIAGAIKGRLKKTSTLLLEKK